jgi:hypothetical protein
MVRRPLRIRLGLAFILATVVIQPGSAGTPVQQPAGAYGRLIDRFLAPDETPLVSYRAFRRLTASTRGGRTSAALEAWTTLDPVHGFSFEITSMEGSGLIQRKVLIAALEAEQAAVQSASNKAQSALTPANYEFLGTTPEPGRLVRMDVKPRRKHVMLIDGALFIEEDSADLVRIEGELSKRPSFWTRRVRVIREYNRVAGVHVPVSMRSTADVMIVGSSSFAMTYRYVEINGKPVPGEAQHP